MQVASGSASGGSAQHPGGAPLTAHPDARLAQAGRLGQVSTEEIITAASRSMRDQPHLPTDVLPSSRWVLPAAYSAGSTNTMPFVLLRALAGDKADRRRPVAGHRVDLRQ